MSCLANLLQIARHGLADRRCANPAQEFFVLANTLFQSLISNVINTDFVIAQAPAWFHPSYDKSSIATIFRIGQYYATLPAGQNVNCE
jgi:hypothetical protein